MEEEEKEDEIPIPTSQSKARLITGDILKTCEEM